MAAPEVAEAFVITLHTDTFNMLFGIVGTFVFAISGAVAGMRRQADIFGVLVLAMTASMSGGICRDILIGTIPPESLQNWYGLLAAVIAAIISFYFYPIVNRLNNPVEIFDAIGLGVFAVLGTHKALTIGITPLWAIMLGVMSGVGGGVARDMLLAQVPIILRAEIYATAALLGAIIVVLGREFTPIPHQYILAVGASVCAILRLLALHYRWHINISPPTE